MRILYVGTLPPQPGGAALSCAESLVGLARRGHAVSAITPITTEAEPQSLVWGTAHSELTIMRFPVPYFSTDQLHPEPEDYRSSVASHLEQLLARAIAESRPDVVLVGRETFIWAAPDIARGPGVPVVQRFGGSMTRALIEGTYPVRLMDELRAKLARIDALVTPGRHLADGMKRLGLEDVRVIPTGVNLERFRPTPRDPILAEGLTIEPGDLVVAHMANLKSWKRSLDLIRSAPHALRRDPQLLYLVVGDGRMRPDLELASRELGVAARVRFAGWQPYEDVPRYLSLADVVVTPSEFEGLSRVYLETQACGRVLIASDIPAAREVVVDGETGLLFPCGDVEALALATLRAAGEPVLRDRIGRNARKLAESHSVTHMVEAYEALLSEVAARSLRPPTGGR
jgi:glycosyltransferase involved in cell wall biosynthesis